MPSAIFRQSLQRQAIALAMAFIVGFLGVAVFSSLHKHQSAKTRCSLNGYDQLMMGEAEVAAAQITVVLLDVAEREASVVFHSGEQAQTIFLRGPPASLHSEV